MNASDMDEMLFQCNKNAIYVLNTNYAYGEFGRLNLFGASAGTSTSSSINNGVRSGMPTPPPSSYSCESLYSRNTSTILASNNLTAETPHISMHNIPSSTTTATIIPKLFHYSHDEKMSSQQQQQQKNSSKCKTNSTSTMTSSKKCSNVKSAIIAKKTKFWKYLEEEKWKKTSIENLSTTNCERNSEGKLMKNNSAIINNNHAKNVNNNINANSNNSSVINNANRNKNSYDSSEKSSSELYKEAAQLLGLSCTLCDNCRCLDCQSRYFECDDSDSYSELSFLGDYYETLDNQSHDLQDHQHNILNTECRSIHSDNSSIGSAITNHSESQRDPSLDDSNSAATRDDIGD